MKNTITLTDEQMKALKSGQSITIEPPKPVIAKWEPKGGGYTITDKLTVEKYVSTFSCKDSGMEYRTQFQAEQAAKALRSYARQLAYLSENDDDWVADWNDTMQEKWFVYFDNINDEYDTIVSSQDEYLSVIYMSENNAHKLCQLLNDGIVEF